MKVILCGYNLVGCEILSQLLKTREISQLYVYTHENPPHIVSLKDYCRKTQVPFTTNKISAQNLPFSPDIICSIYYRYIINPEIIKAVKGKIFNLHPSLLPKYRGCSSITWSIINGEIKTGFTYHYINEGIDTGNILWQQEIELSSFETQQSLYYRIMIESAKTFELVFSKVVAGDLGRKQDDSGEYFERGAPYDGQIDDSWPEDKIERFIRALNFPPLPYATYKGKEIQTFEDFLRVKAEE